jgi:hypothetical protein
MFYGYISKKKRILSDVGLAMERRHFSRKRIPARLFQRVTAQIQVVQTGQVLNGRVFLHDLTANGVGIFLTEQIKPETEINLVIEQPRHLFFKARVKWCSLHQINMRVITAESFGWRAGLQFEFDLPADRELVERYCAELIDGS